MPQKKPTKPVRTLMVLTRDEGVREENPLLTTRDNKYYLPSNLRTPALRKEADELMPPARIIRKGLTVGGKKMEQKFMKSKGY